MVWEGWACTIRLQPGLEQRKQHKILSSRVFWDWRERNLAEQPCSSVTFCVSDLVPMKGHQIRLLVASCLVCLLPLEALRPLGRAMGARVAELGVKKPGPGRAGSCEPGVRGVRPVLPSVPFSYKPGRNVASEGVSSVDRRQEEQSVPSVSICLSQLGLGLPPPL